MKQYTVLANYAADAQFEKSYILARDIEDARQRFMLRHPDACVVILKEEVR